MTWILLAFLLCTLSSIDGILSFHAVTSGLARELNPVWIWLLATHPHVFLIVKTFVSVLFSGMLAVIANLKDRNPSSAKFARWCIVVSLLVYTAVLFWHLVYILN